MKLVNKEVEMMIKQVNSHSKGGNEVNYIYFHKAHPLPYKAEPTTRRT